MTETDFERTVRMIRNTTGSVRIATPDALKTRGEKAVRAKTLAKRKRDKENRKKHRRAKK